MKKVWYVQVTGMIGFVVLFFLCLFLCLSVKKKDQDKISAQRLNYLCARQVGQLEKEQYAFGKYSYYIIDLKGNVIQSRGIRDRRKGGHVPLQEILLQQDFFEDETCKNIIYPVFLHNPSKGEKVDRLAVFSIPKKELYQGDDTGKKIRMILMCVVLIYFAFQGLLVCYVKRRVSRPIEEITKSASEIIRGNYTKEVVRTYGSHARDGEISDLIYSFESMRDELQEKQRNEERLKRAEKELISCISHDVKTPLSTIKAYVEGIRDGVAGTEEEKERFLHIILNKIDVISGMTTELLEFSNAQMKQLRIEKKEQYFRQYFFDLMKELSVYLKQGGGTLVWEYVLEEALCCFDSFRLTEVFYNLIENSIKYQSEKPLLVEIKAYYQARNLVVLFRDNGMGISAEDIPFLFDKFYRAEKSRSQRIPGSGLGLSICKYIIEEHGGTISCENQTEGCLFLIKIPICS